jgi:hypothetical protein
MKPKTEIYKIHQGRFTDKDGVPRWAISYEIGSSGYVYGGLVTPVEIKLLFDKVLVTYDDGRTHEFKKTDDCEIFRRPVKEKEKEEENG